MDGSSKYSCETAGETLEWITAIAQFIKPYDFLINAHVVNFFTDRLWESLDQEWLACLSPEPIENLLLIPSGAVQEHWPASLKEFVLTLRSLSFPRDQVDLQKVFPGLDMISLNSVLAQGMNAKKKHEVEVLSAVVSSLANAVGVEQIVDVGSGQGYLAQVLSFQYRHSVVAIDASPHHGRITDTRAERIKKYYTAQMHKSGSENGIPVVPKTVTCRIMSIEALRALTNMSLHASDIEQPRQIEQVADCRPSLILAGLHACGDLSVTMLKTFLEWEEVKAVVSIGCCYNLLSEEYVEVSGAQHGFPMSYGVKSSGITLGKSSRDLACQSAERWRTLEKDEGVHNFELHAFRAAFQMVLCRYFPEITTASPSVGRQGKALRRKQQRRIPQISMNDRGIAGPVMSGKISNAKKVCGTSLPAERKTDGVAGFLESNASHIDNYMLFKKFSQSALSRLGLKDSQEINFCEIWKEAEPFAELIGPYWSLRAAFGPVLETLILLDRLLFLQEQGSSLEAVMLPIFDPALSPRNVAIFARRNDGNGIGAHD